MNLSATSIEPPDSAFFSSRAKSFRLFNEHPPSANVEQQQQQQHAHKDLILTNRLSVPSTETRLAPIGRGSGSMISNDYRPGTGGAGRGRTTVPLSPFVLQKNDLSSSNAPIPSVSAPVFVMHDEVQFVRPYFGPPDSQLPLSHKRQVLLSALKGIETGLKTL